MILHANEMMIDATPSPMSAHASRGSAHRERGGAIQSLFFVLVLGAGGAAYWYYGQNKEAPALDEARIVKVEIRDVIDGVKATGRIEPEARVEVMSRASGILKERFVEEGDTVTKNQVLAELDREQLKAQDDENEANMKAAQARLAAAKARVEEAKVRLVDPEMEFAKREVDRIQKLYDGGDESEAILDDAKLKLRNVEYRIQQVKANLPVLEAGILQSDADLASAKAAYDRTQTALKEATIRSPIDGVVLLREKEVGDGVSSILTAGGNATKILTLGDLSKLYVQAKVDEADLGRIAGKTRALITSDAFKEKKFEGEVVRIAPAGTVDNNGISSFQVKILIKVGNDDPDKQQLRVDMTANVVIVVDERDHALSLVQKALQRTPDGKWRVTRVKSTSPPVTESIDVQIGVSDGVYTEVVSGVAEGDRILLPMDRPMQMG